MSANIKASTDGTQAIIGVGGVDQMTVSNAGVVTANSFVGNIAGLQGNLIPVTATGSTTARTLANRTADIYNVKDFGAIGDGVANDKDAIQLAIDTATAAGGGTVYFPKGTYLTKSTILAKSNVTLIGDGPESEIKADPDSVRFVPTPGPGPTQHVQNSFIIILIIDNTTNFHVKNLKFNSSELNPPQTIPPSTGNDWFTAQDIYAYVANNISVDNCEFLCAGSATAFLDSSLYSVKNNKVTQQSLDSTPHADASIDQWRDVTDALIVNNTVRGNSKWGILVTANTGGGPSIVKNVQILNNNVSNTSQQGIHVMGRDGTCSQIVVSNNIVTNTIAAAIAITDSKDFVCSNNVIKDSFQHGIYVAREYVPFGGTGSISGTTLTITSVSYGSINLNQRAEITAVGVISGTRILNQISGTPGGVGTYTVSISQTVGSTFPMYVGGWRMPDYGFESCVIANNSITNAGYLNPASSTSSQKSAIYVNEGNVNAGAIVSSNTVDGTSHSYAAYLGTQGIQHIGGAYKVGQSFTYTNLGSMIRFGTEDPQAMKWVSFSEADERTKIYSEVNAGSAYQEIQINNGYTRFNQVSGSGLNTAFQITRVNNSETGITIYPDSNTTTGPIIIASSTAADSDLYLFPKANGKVKFGTRVATSDVPITGYIEIKDSANNIRKLAVIA